MSLDESFRDALVRLETDLMNLETEALTLDARDQTGAHAQALVTVTVRRLADMIGGFPTPVRVSSLRARPAPRHQRPTNIPKFFPPDVPAASEPVQVEPIELPDSSALTDDEYRERSLGLVSRIFGRNDG